MAINFPKRTMGSLRDIKSRLHSSAKVSLENLSSVFASGRSRRNSSVKLGTPHKNIYAGKLMISWINLDHTI